MLTGAVAPTAPRAVGLDMAVPLTTDRARHYADRRYCFCVRYISRTEDSRAAHARRGCTDLSADDLDEMPEGTLPADIIGYAKPWFAQVTAAGYAPWVYVGCNVWLPPERLFVDLRLQPHWRAARSLPDIRHRGYLKSQHCIRNDNGSVFDRNVAMPDALGNSAICLAPWTITA